MGSKAIGRRLKYLREQANKTLTDVADDTGIPPTTLSAYERGKMSMTVERLEALARYYGVSCSWLVTGKDPYVDLSSKWPLGYQVLSRASHELTEDDKRKLYELCKTLIDNPQMLDQIDVDRIVEKPGGSEE